MPASLQIAGRDHHLLRALHQQPGEADGIRLVLAVRLDQLIRRHLDAQIDHVVAVVAENDLDQVLADIVDVALHGGEHDLAARRGVGLLHELFEMVDGGLHRFGRLQHFGDDQLVVVEQPADFGHAGHQRAVDDVERRGAFGALAVEIGDQAVLGAFDDVVRQALIERQIRGLAALRLRRRSRKCSAMAAMWNWLMRGLLLARLLRASPRARCAAIRPPRRPAAC